MLTPICTQEAEKTCLDRGEFPESLGILGPPPAGLRWASRSAVKS